MKRYGSQQSYRAATTFVALFSLSLVFAAGGVQADQIPLPEWVLIPGVSIAIESLADWYSQLTHQIDTRPYFLQVRTYV